ncbi:MAG: hypothetical protein ACOCNB_01880 [Acetivibrio ethanolgignens]
MSTTKTLFSPHGLNARRYILWRIIQYAGVNFYRICIKTKESDSILLGNQSSQWFALYYLDRFIKERLFDS